MQESWVPDVVEILQATAAAVPFAKHLKKHWKLYAVVIVAGVIVAIVCSAYGITLAGTVAAFKAKVTFCGQAIFNACSVLLKFIVANKAATAGVIAAGVIVGVGSVSVMKRQAAKKEFAIFCLQRAAEMRAFNKIRQDRLTELGVPSVTNDPVFGRFYCSLLHDIPENPIKIIMSNGIAKYFEQDLLLKWRDVMAAAGLPFTNPEDPGQVITDAMCANVDVDAQAMILARLHELLEFGEAPSLNMVTMRATLWQPVRMPPAGPTLRSPLDNVAPTVV